MISTLFTYKVEYADAEFAQLYQLEFDDYESAIEFAFTELPSRRQPLLVWVSSISQDGHEALLCYFSTSLQEHGQ